MLKKLFSQHGLTEVKGITNGIIMYQQSSARFYFITEYSEGQFLDYDDAPITESIINLYSAQQIDNPSVTKNSSLIILLKCNEYVPSETLLNKIYAVEEDPYGMRKYVIVAQSDIIDQLKTISYEGLTQIVFNKGRFDKYQKSGTSNNDHEFMGAIQVFIKLPFLRMQESKEKLQTITELTDSLMKKDDYLHIKNQNLGSRGAIFDDREEFLSKALSLERNSLDGWLDQTLGGTQE